MMNLNMSVKHTPVRGPSSRLFPRFSLLLLLASLFPVGVLAAWSTPGEDFSGELTLGGPVTSTRNPWSWKMASGNDAISLSTGDRISRNGEQTWPVLLKGSAVLLGKTTLVTPAGREGLAPRVHFGRGDPEAELVWQQDGEGQVTLPVFGAEAPSLQAGTLTFSLQTAMMLRHVQGGAPVYAAVYSDLSGNGLPPQGLTLPAGKTAPQLCRLFAGEGPAWLCAGSPAVQGAEALSRLNDSELRQVQAVYGAGIVAGSGELRMRDGEMPTSWKTVLPISIEYQ